MASRITTIQSAKKFLLECGWEFEEYEGYSGRGMFGATCSAAFVTDAGPRSECGAALINNGWQVDNMGKSWIYYRR